MRIFPAIDVLDGQVVRLYQGNYEKKQIYSDLPAAIAARFLQQGATHLHLVDLSGAKSGVPRNFGAVQAVLAAAPGLFVELGGGIRDEETVIRCFNMGVGRVILGTAALKNPDFTRRMAKTYGDKIAVGVDARNGFVAVEGWMETSRVDSIEFCKELRENGIKYVIYTDISRDGAEQGANLAIYETLASIEGLNITASGGVSSMEDIEVLRDMGLYGAIVGKALYSGKIDLYKAISVAAAPRKKPFTIASANTGGTI